jgi:hypothetical protein
VLGRQSLHQQVLRAVRVLILVHHDVLELPRVALTNRRHLLEQLDRLEEQVVEVQGLRIGQGGRVERVELGEVLLARIPGGVERLGPLHAVLGVADARQRRSRLNDAVVESQRSQRPASSPSAGRSSRR